MLMADHAEGGAEIKGGRQETHQLYQSGKDHYHPKILLITR